MAEEPVSPEVLDRNLVGELAARFNRPVEEVGQIYARQVAELTRGARVETYLQILAARLTRRILIEQG